MNDRFEHQRAALVSAFAALCGLLLGGCGDESTAPSPSATATVSAPTTSVRFVDATEVSGVDFKHHAGRSELKLMPEIMGSGVAIADFDRDGAPDIVLANGGNLRAEQRPAHAANRLFLNDGAGRFHDATVAWALPSQGYGMGVAVGDYDNDGFVDLYLTHFDGNDQLLRNTGAGFVDVTTKVGIESDGMWSTSAGFFDYDRDGRLDLYVTRYLKFSVADAPKTFRNELLVYPTPLLFEPVADRVWRNLGDGRFEDVSAGLGLLAAPGKGLALAIGDLDGNATDEIYVANDTAANQLWLSSHTGPWQDVGAVSGAAFDDQGREEGSMGADYSDYDGDGLLDITVSNFQLEATSIYRQQQPLLFRETADLVGVGLSSRARLSFGIDFFDVDNDGWEDLLVANGHIEDNVHVNSDSVTFAQANSLYLNHGDGRFVDISAQAGAALAVEAVSRGLATADLNGDGALDFVISNNDALAQVAYNQSEAGNFVMLWLEGTRSNRSAIGARVEARIGERLLQRQVMGAQSYLSVSDFRLHFGLGEAEQIDQLLIHWPSGETQQLTDVAAGSFYHLREGGQLQAFVPGEFAAEATQQ